MRSNTIENYKKTLKLSKLQREILVGILLGDATLETQGNGRTSRLKVEQGLKHKPYVEHLYNVFREWVLTPPRIRKIEIRNKTYQNVAFSTVSHPAFRFYNHQFYQDGRKVVPRLIHRWLTPRNIAYWYMDDGSIRSRQSKGVIFNTQGFSHIDVQRLCAVLRDRFGLEGILRRQREGWQIYISGRSYEKLVDTIRPSLINSMLYKLPQSRRT